MADRTIEMTARADSTPGAFRIADVSGAAPIHRVGSEPVIGIAAGDLADDVERVSDRTPSVEVGLPDGGERRSSSGPTAPASVLTAPSQSAFRTMGLTTTPSGTRS